MQRSSSLIVAVAAFALAGCGGGGGRLLQSFIIEPDDFTARVGDRVPFAALGTYDDGSVGFVTREVTWASSDAAAASLDAGGVLTAKAQGTAQVSASLGALAGNLVAVTIIPVPNLPTADLLPLALNNQWTYTGTVVTTGVAATAQQRTLVVRVAGQVVKEQSVWWELLAEGSDGAAPNHLFWRHDPAGLTRYETYGTLPVVFLASDPQPGMTWQDPEDKDITFEVESVTDTVDVPAGSYSDCVRVVETDAYYDPPDRNVAWYKAGVGMVKTEYYQDGALNSEQRLLRLDLGSQTTTQ